MIQIKIDPNGGLSFLHNDDLAGLIADASCIDTQRASHVEPVDNGMRWSADLSPVGGPVLGPFLLRRQALDAEAEWLQANIL